jgi:hypothetical protein
MKHQPFLRALAAGLFFGLAGQLSAQTFKVLYNFDLNSALLSAAFALFTQAAFAQTWSTVDDFQYALGTNSNATGLAKDPTGTIIYSAGNGQDASGVYHAVSFKSIDGGTTWSHMDDYVDPTSSTGGNYGVGYDAGIAADPVGNIYAAGFENLPNGSYIWFTRRSLDGGATWSTVDSFSGSQPYSPYPTAIATDARGNVYVVGTTNYTWLVRKGTDNFQPSQSVHSQASAFSSDAHGNLFVAGTSGGTQWLVRKNLGGSGSWQTVDTFQLAPSLASVPRAVIGNGSGNVFVGGYGTDATRVQHWIVRKQ